MEIFNQLFAPIERLINEHGSAALLREQIALIKAKGAEQEARNAQLEHENKALKAQLLQHQARLGDLEQQIKTLTEWHHSGFCCDACGSPRVKRTGSKPDPVFGMVGVKQGLFTCAECGHVSAFTLD